MDAEELPEGWAAAKLPDVVRINMGQSPPGSSYNNRRDGLAFFQGKAEFGARHPTAVKWCTSPTKIAEPGDVLISVRAPVGPTNVADQTCAIGRGLAALTPLCGIPTDFVLYALRLQEPELALSGTGSTFTAISKGDLVELQIALPPLAEQQRIVAKVEELLSQVNAARHRLARTAALLKRFRQSLLAAACDGRLTADWRGDGTPSNGSLPGGWELALVSDVIVEPLRNGRSVLTAVEGFPILRLTCLKSGRVDLSERKLGAWSEDEARPFLVRSGDFLVARGNGSLSLVGRGGLVEDTSDGVAYPDLLIRVRPSEACDVRFLRLIWDSPHVREQIEAAAKTTAGIHKVSQQDLSRISIPLPMPPEQHEIVRRVDALFALADAIESRVAAATARAERLTQSILAKAFRGELVPTEAELARREGRDYEPTSALLARIRSERAAEPTKARARRGRG